MRALALAAFCALAAGCAQQSVERADSGQIAPDNAPCESTLDAIGFTCTDGLEFSARHDPDTQCVVLFLYDNTLVLPYDQARGANTDGAITFEQRGSSATLSRIASGAASQCEMVEQMRGYFGIGAEEMSKPMNLGALMRTSHAFGASFFFTINAHPKVREAYNSDTSRSFDHMPYYPYDTLDAMRLPKGCALVGVELTDDAVELPRFQHPQAAAYVLGRERGSLSDELISRCQHVIKIPTKFCINVGLAGALVMYDRLLAHGGYPARPIMPGGPAPDMTEALRKRRQS